MINRVGTFCGFEIVSSDLIPETERRQYRFARSKRKRIQKKFAKDANNWRDHAPFYFVGGRYITNSKNVQKISLAL